MVWMMLPYLRYGRNDGRLTVADVFGFPATCGYHTDKPTMKSIKKYRPRGKTSGWFLSPIWSVWLNQTNQINKTNQMNQTDRASE